MNHYKIITVGFIVMVLSGGGLAHSSYLSSLSPIENADEHIVWQRAPIKINLPVGKERFVSFPQAVTFGYNTYRLPTSTLRIENDHQTLYLLAKKPFPTERTEAKLASGEIILLDIQGQSHAADNPIDIVLPNNMQASANNLNDYLNPSPRINYVTLMRYAIQQLYAPQRVLQHTLFITRFPMETAHVVPIFYDDSAVAMPLASWRGDDLYVTALLVKNRLNQPLRLQPQQLCGDWKASSFYPQRHLAPHGAALNHDASTVFVISNVPFSQAIAPCLSQYATVQQ